MIQKLIPSSLSIVIFIMLFGINSYEFASAQMPPIDTSILDKTSELMDKSEQMMEKTEQMMDKTEQLMQQGSEVVSQVGEVTGQIGGGCLIATATYGSELAPQVQLLRELRDNIVLNTSSGTTFMTTFNQFYYSFSPTIADWEKQNQPFKEIVKLTITPLLTSLSILNYVDIDSDNEMLVYGISIILLNIGMYFAVPAIFIIKIKKKFK